jgi:hypothetical protein
LGFFFSPPLCPEILYLPPTSPLLPTTFQPHPPSLHHQNSRDLEQLRPRAAGAGVREFELWLWSGSWSGWSRSGTHAPTKPTRPRGGKTLTFFFVFSICFVWRRQRCVAKPSSYFLFAVQEKTEEGDGSVVIAFFFLFLC